MLVRGVIVTGFTFVAALVPASAGAAWVEPLERWDRGQVIAGFDYGRAEPFRRGARRGADLEGRHGAPVRAVCSGSVTHAGPVPGRGLGVSLRCGELVATELGLGSVDVRSGQLVAAGANVGRLGRDGILRLGARRVSDRWGYLDPMSLIGAADDAPPALGPAPRGGAPHHRVRFAGRPHRPHAEVPAGPRSPVPLAAWIALGLIAASVGGIAGVGTSSVGRRWAPSSSPRRSIM